ncbi:MAG: hypothetical protein SFT92_02900 [Rickettsiales bacterium]|nr:hypothetical protein [Rickettsiales bacterium]
MQHTIEYCLRETVGEKGVDPKELAAICTQLDGVLAALQQRKDPMAGALLDVPFRSDDLAEIEAVAREIQARFKHVVIVGAGGAVLSGHVLTQLKPRPWPVAMHYLDNIDPDALDDCLAQIELTSCCFLVISKSGGTVETLSQFYVLYERMKAQLGKKAAAHFIIITTTGSSPLYESAAALGMRRLEYDHHIGGRFSTLINVGLLPAAICGLNIRKFREGAQPIIRALDQAKTAQNCPSAVGAALQYAYLQKGRNISVMLPYSSRLSGFSSWYRQSWSESLGKDGKSSTPIRAVGTTDQHSQLQLYLDGPKDKLFHLITVQRTSNAHQINAPERADLDYLKGKTLTDVMVAEEKATLQTLVRSQCPVRMFILPSLAEEHIGALLTHMTLEIIFMAALLQVNPFDQPAVEEGKVLARNYLLQGTL